jgi:fluoride exporter
METFSKIFAVAIGGAFGASARYLLSISPLSTVFPNFPFPTFFINITGSLIIGFVLTKFESNETLRLLLVTGFLGAYTTFSTFEFEAFQLTQTKQIFTAFLYVALSFAIGFIGVAIGIWLAKNVSN